MRPLSSHLGERHSRRRAAGAARRVLLCAACFIGFALNACAEGATGAAASPALREKDVRRAEKVLAKLSLLDEAAAANDASAYRARASELYPGLFITVADMYQSDLQTDLSTAVFLYEEVGRTWFNAGDTAADCGRERKDIYLPLCFDLRGGRVRQLLRAKACLHTRWAEAVVRNYRDQCDAETSRNLSEMKVARANDLVIAARIVETLKPLEELVNTLPTYADHQERRTASKVDFDGQDGEFAAALGIAGDLLTWMPRSPTFYHLSNARRSYTDGLFWYQKIHQSKKLVVSASVIARDPLKDLSLDDDQVGDTVLSNWKSSTKYIRLAEQSLSGAARR